MGVRIREKAKGKGWWVFVSHRGVRRSKCVGDHAEARKLAKELRAALAAGDLGLDRRELPADQPLTFGAFVETWLANAEAELKRSTWTDYRYCIQKRLAPAFGARALVDLRRRDVKDFAATLRAEGLSLVNMKKHLRILSSILSAGVEDELIAANPCMGGRRRRRSKQHNDQTRRIDPLTREESDRLLSTAHDHAIRRGRDVVYPYRRWFPFLLLLVRTGLRLSEAIALQWGDIDWSGEFIAVRRAYVRGKIDKTKSGKVRRVFMTSQLTAALRELFAERYERVIAIDAEAQVALEQERAQASEAWIFPADGGGLVDASHFRRQVWRPLLEAAGRRRIRLHDLRHTYASQLLASGAELHFVQEQLGHHSPAFTLSVYGHLVPRDRRRDVDVLDTAPVCTPAAPESGNTVPPETGRVAKPAGRQGVGDAARGEPPTALPDFLSGELTRSVRPSRCLAPAAAR